MMLKLAFCPDLTDNNEIKAQKIWEKFLDKKSSSSHKLYILFYAINIQMLYNFF